MRLEPGERERWARIQSLFEQIVDLDDASLILAQESDRQVAEEAMRLWSNHRRASEAGFLNEPITLVRGLNLPDDPRFAAGQLLARRFEIVRLLGTGGMGEVYLAIDQRLHECVAVKTIRQHLAADPAVRRRFLAEIQNARRVTHPSVCRIFDLFEEEDTPFFSMEYLEGVRLSDWLGVHTPSPALAKRLALELAEALAAAHGRQILHCDFKPANVILCGDPADPHAVITDFGLARAFLGQGGQLSATDAAVNFEASDAHSLQAGTFGYMAPELLAGERPTVQSDIYAYGRVLGELIPGHRFAASCQALRPQDRPPSLDPVINDLRGQSTRRMWLLGTASLAAAGFAGYELLSRPRPALASRQRIVFNAFRPGQATRASSVRELLITALRQSPLLSVVADDHLRALLRHANSQSSLPADRGVLLAVAAREGIPLVIEGTLEENSSGLRILLQLFESPKSKSLLDLTEQVDDVRNIVRLADRTALRVRREVGESPASLRSGYTPLEQVTSASPEAVEFYLRGVREYESARAKAAEAWFDQAIQIDRQFALAHLHRGISLAARSQVAAAIPSYERAFELRNHITERERLWIESRYYNIIGDFVSSLEACRRLVLLYPEEATFQRNAAFACVRIARPNDALPYSKRAVELDPTSDNNLSELLVNHVEANLYDDALALYARFRQEGHTSTLLDYGAGLAYMGKGDYQQARKSFEQMAIAPERERASRLSCCGPLILDGEFVQAASELSSDLAYDVATGEQGRRNIRRVWLGLLDWLMDTPGSARRQAETLAGLDPSPSNLQALREGGMLALLLGESRLASESLERLRQIEHRWPSTHTHGARAHLAAAILHGAEPAQAHALFEEAFGLWPDPLTLYSRALAQLADHDYKDALSTLDIIEHQRGRLLRHYFPGLLVLSWIERARCLAAMSRFTDAQRMYERVLNHWGRRAGSFHIVRQVHQEFTRLKLDSKKENKGEI